MPEIDTDLFQVLTLLLLIVAVVVTLIALQTLNRIRKVLEEGAFRSSGGGERAFTPATSQYTAAEPAAMKGALQTPQPATTTQPGAGGAASVGLPLTAQPAAAQPAPAQAAPAPVAARPAAAAAEPENQPFERDGRWWFRRGTELLVYDEQAAQWVPAPAGAHTQAAGPAAGTPAAGGYVGATETTESAGDFWKCPSCGAVNGSTAASCRMCFTARP